MNTIATRLVQSVKRWATDPSGSASDGPLSILVVDDEESILRYVDRILTEAGYRTTLAANGAEAIIAAARGGRFDLLLTDVAMPEMSGAQLALKLRETDPDLKVLYLTGYSDRLFREDGARPAGGVPRETVQLGGPAAGGLAGDHRSVGTGRAAAVPARGDV
jgi:CheY-like chemotaxis protein